MSQTTTKEQRDKVIAWTRAGRKLETQPYDDDVIEQVDEWSEREGTKAKNIILEQNKRMFSILKRSDQPVAQSKIDADFKKEIDKIERLPNPGQGYVQMRIDLNNKLSQTLQAAIQKLCEHSDCKTQKDVNNITEPINKIMASNPADVIGCYEKAFKETIELTYQAMKKQMREELDKEFEPKPKPVKKVYTKEELAEQARKVDAQWADETPTTKTKAKATPKSKSKSKTKTKETTSTLSGGAGSGEVFVETVKEPKAPKSECDILVDTIQEALTRFERIKLPEFIGLKSYIARLWKSLTPSQKAILDKPNDRINNRIRGLMSDTCLNPSEVKKATSKQSGSSNGKKFERLIVKKDIVVLSTTGEVLSLYDKKGIRNYDTASNLQSNAKNEDYLLADASLYDLCTDAFDIEIKYYVSTPKVYGTANINDVYIPLEKFYGNKHFVPYFRLIDGRVKLYNVWCEDTKAWINEKDDKEILFLIMTDKGLVVYNYTDVLTKSYNSGTIENNWRREPINIKIDAMSKKDMSGGALLSVLNIDVMYDRTVIDFPNGGEKTCALIPEDELMYCYIKK